MKLKERIAFLRQFRHQLNTTGAVQPSSRFLAREMARPVRTAPRLSEDHAVHIVEMGPGTGAVTRALAEAMGPADELDCYEINPQFVEFLSARVRTETSFATVHDRIRVHCAAAQEAQPDGQVDFVVCSVPLNNLPAAVVEAIFERGLELLAEHGGTFTFFEYPFLPRFKRLLSSGPERTRIDAVHRLKRTYRAGRSTARLVPVNIPPARAVHIRVPASG